MSKLIRDALDEMNVRDAAERGKANRIVQETLRRFMEVLNQHEPPTPRQRAERRGLRVIEGGKKR